MNVSSHGTGGGVRVRTLVALSIIWASAVFSAHAADSSLAKVTAIQNTVETKTAAAAGWSASKEGQALVANDRVRTGPASRASLLYSDQTMHRLNEKSEVEILPPSGGGSGIVKILSGQSYFTTRTPKDFGRVQTPAVTAAIKGTEFAVSVADDGTTVITMIEGVVEASNEHGSVTVTKGEEAVTEPGKAPQRRIAVRPKDAVAWSLYYPQVLGGSERGNPKLDQAASALSAGQVDEAHRLLEEVKVADRSSAGALALESVVALTADRKDEARSLADSALRANGSSPSALLARSFVAQADFDLPKARELAESAATADPQNAEALARVAELRLAEGDHNGARKAAEQAVSRQPGNARALTVLGFVNLAAYRTDDAALNFEHAVAADSGFPLAHAGRGIAKIRQGLVASGREELQTAATLDPGESLYRSYLGKAYYEEYRSKEAMKELSAAKELDPNDPTPWLYSAILLQNENRPVEALKDLNESIAKNDNRAVYRSRLLLDEDRAVRGTDLARIYDDLGFDQLGLVEARRSADVDQANFSSHLFLAGNYRNLPGFASSFLSETLQARIYQPIGANAARPDFQGGTVSFNEYTQLFDRPRFRGFVGGSYGYTDTDLSELFPVGCGSACTDFFDIEDSRLWSGNATGTYNGDRVAASLSYRKYVDDGFRDFGDQDTSVATGFVEVAPSVNDTLQLNAIVASRDTGDLPIRQIPLDFIAGTAIDTDEVNIGVGWHHRATAKTDIAVSGIWNNTQQEALSFGTSVGDVELNGFQLEGQIVNRQRHVSWIGGAGLFDGTFDAGPSGEGPERFGSIYGYAKIRDLGPVEIVAGAAAEGVRSPVGLLPPRDSQIIPSSVEFDTWRLSPKVGLTATFKSGTTIRAAVFSKLASSIGRLQTLEPTQVSGFNQFYEDVGGTRSWNYGLGFDQKLGIVFFGASGLRRESVVPEADCPTPGQFSGCRGQQGTQLAERDNVEDLVSLYANVLIWKIASASVDYNYSRRDFETTVNVPLTTEFEDYNKTKRLRPQVRVFLPVGFYTSVAGSYYTQEVHLFLDVTSAERRVQTARFWTLDAAVGWRLPRRLGSISIEGTNLSDREFLFYEQSLQENVIPARRIALRADFAF
jgi:tetratricopeptide (TPR) repeat protein